MKIKYVWLADFSDKAHSGGAQLTNRRIIDRGLEMGFDIEEIYLDDFSSGKKTLPMGKNVVYIINNFVHWYRKFPNNIKDIIENMRFIRFVHDYDFVYRGIIPEEIIKKVFEKAEVSFFLSRLHLEQTELADIKIKNKYIIPSPINIHAYSKAGYESNKNKTRIKNSVIYIGEIATHKGINNIINYALMNPHLTLNICGWVAAPYLLESLPKNVRVLEKIDNSKMPGFLAKYEYAIHLPIWFEPFGRSVAEAFFAGCKLIVNDRVGFMDYIRNLSDISITVKIIKESPTVFWLKTDDVVKRIEDTSGKNDRA